MGAASGARKLGVWALAVACSFAALGGIEDASARGNRNTCFNDRAGIQGRQTGERNAKRLFDQVWRRLNRDCSQLDRLITLISEMPLAAPRTKGAYQGCFYAGYTETLFAQLDDTAYRCEDACFNAGAEIGRISAQGYCYASMALGGLDDPGFISQPDLPICGANVVMGCKSEYINTAVFDIAGCREFTEDYFEFTFDNTVRQDCYVPSDVPVRDGRGHYNALASSSADQLF